MWRKNEYPYQPSTAANTIMSNTISATKHWLERLVIGHNLCPFAAKPFHDRTIHYDACSDTDTDAIFKSFLLHLAQFDQSREDMVETSLLIFDKGLSEFKSYLDMLALAENAIYESGLEGVYQIASFHPDYIFEGSDEDDPANYSNRSPYPMFHLLREESMEAILEDVAKPQNIPERNIKYLRTLGIKKITAIIDSNEPSQ